MLKENKLRALLDCLPSLSIGVVGDFFLDRYFDIDARLTEQSLETGLDAYQVVGVRASPGAAGTVTNNLSALGVGEILALTVIGDDGEGYQLRRELTLRRVDLTYVMQSTERMTPTYMKPMLGSGSGSSRELNRLDIKNRSVMSASLASQLRQQLEEVFARVDALIVADQVQEPDCGVIGSALRRGLEELGSKHPQKLILVDSRERIGLFRHVTLKPNQAECLAAVGLSIASDPKQETVREAAKSLAKQNGRFVYCTLAATGILVTDGHLVELAPAYPVSGPIDIVGAGDSATAGIACALAAGATPLEAATLGNLVASITVQQIGTTGTATPAQVLERNRTIKQLH